jgi:glycosyltransferase involved in cell wall biosynthesis
VAGAEKEDIVLKILIITGSYPPDKCGVGSYTYSLANALAAKSGLEIGVLTSVGKDPPYDSSRVKLFRLISGWKIKNMFQVKRIVSEFRPDVVHIQYPTQGYNGRLSKFLPILMRFMGVPVIQTWHEYFASSGVGWPNLLACNALIYARPDLPKRIPFWVIKCLGKTPMVYVANASTIPVVTLSSEQALNIKQDLSGGKPIVCFFGFAHVNKGMEQLFEIADPAKHHLVLICDLSDKDAYQSNILRIIKQTPWAGRVTVTGFQPARRVGEILAVADAILFPYPSGAGEWNTSLIAAQATGTFTLATTNDPSLLGYNEQKNTYFAGCGQVLDMREALNKYLGRRVQPLRGNEWERVALAHEQIYRSLFEKK